MTVPWSRAYRCTPSPRGITEYGGVTFRSHLEARRAAYFDRQGIAREYAGAARRLVSRFPARPGRRRGLRRSQAGEQVSHGRGPADTERRLEKRSRHPGPGAAPRLASPRRQRPEPGRPHRVTTAPPVGAIARRDGPVAAQGQTLCVVRDRRKGTRQWPPPRAGSSPGPRRRSK